MILGHMNHASGFPINNNNNNNNNNNIKQSIRNYIVDSFI